MSFATIFSSHPSSRTICGRLAPLRRPRVFNGGANFGRPDPTCDETRGMRRFRDISALGARQHAVVTTAQMGVDDAVIRRAEAARLLYPKYRGFYGLSPRLTREGKWMAAVLAAGEGAG